MADVPSRRRTGSGDSEGGELDKALALAKTKAAAVRAILNSSRIPPDEAAGPLMTGWQQIARALEQIGNREQAHASLTLERALEPGGILFKTRNISIADIEELSRAHSKYIEGVPSELESARWGKVAKGLEYAILSLEKWNIGHTASKKARICYLVGRVSFGVGALVAIAAIVVGFVISFIQPGKSDGLSATYYVKPDFSGHFFNRIDHNVNFDWGARAPLYGVPANGFSVRWQGCILIEKNHPMFLVSGSDDGMKVFVDGSLFIDNKGPHNYTEKWAQKALKPGTHSIRIDYVEGRGSARVFLGWSKNKRMSPEAIPYSNLIPLSGNLEHTCPYLTVKEDRISPKP
jgi:hypothetical protein